MLRTLAKSILTPRMRRSLGDAVARFDSWTTAVRRNRWYTRVAFMQPGSLVQCMSYTISINDGPNFAVLHHDIVVRRIYEFQATRHDPRILDCGSNIGMSILFFKHLYPKARVTGFEPDPSVMSYLEGNIRRNNLQDVQVVQAAIGGKAGTLSFYSDAKYGSCLAHLMPGKVPQGWTRHDVPCVRLRDYLGEPVDFMKMNIEGAEWEAVEDSGELLRNVKEMAIEYHHLPGLPRALHKILALLHELGFEYSVSDFDLATYSGARPPISLTPETTYFRHIYAVRKGR